MIYTLGPKNSSVIPLYRFVPDYEIYNDRLQRHGKAKDIDRISLVKTFSPNIIIPGNWQSSNKMELRTTNYDLYIRNNLIPKFKDLTLNSDLILRIENECMDIPNEYKAKEKALISYISSNIDNWPLLEQSPFGKESDDIYYLEGMYNHDVDIDFAGRPIIKLFIIGSSRTQQIIMSDMHVFTLIDEKLQALGWYHRWIGERSDRSDTLSDFDKLLIEYVKKYGLQQSDPSIPMLYRVINNYCQTLYVCQERLRIKHFFLQLDESERPFVWEILRNNEDKNKVASIIAAINQITSIGILWQIAKDDDEIKNQMKSEIDRRYSKNRISKEDKTIEHFFKQYRKMLEIRNEYTHKGFSVFNWNEIVDLINDSFFFLITVYDAFYKRYFTSGFTKSPLPTQKIQPIRAFVERIEGEKAILLLGEDELLQVDVLIAWLPKGVKEGTVLRLNINIDSDATNYGKNGVQSLMDSMPNEL